MKEQQKNKDEVKTLIDFGFAAVYAGNETLADKYFKEALSLPQMIFSFADW